MKDMAKTFCANVGTVKCITGLKGNCKPKGVDIPPEVIQVKDIAHGALDCMCKDCPDALGKILTISEKEAKGEYTGDQDKLKAACGLYPDAQCLMAQSSCQDAVKMVLAMAPQDDPN